MDAINAEATKLFPGDTHTYYSADAAADTDVAHQFPTEFLNALNPSGVPPHKLELKLSMPVMLLRNLNARKALG